MKEQNYDFRKRHWQVHRPGRWDRNRNVAEDEVIIDDSWKILNNAGRVAEKAAEDLRDYFWESMGLSVGRANEDKGRLIIIKEDRSLDSGFVLDVTENRIELILADDFSAFRGTVYIEDCMNLERAPVLKKERSVRRPMLKSRQVHSGSGIDMFPEEELRATVHAGYDTVVLFVKGFDLTAAGKCDINGVIELAASYGIKVHLYNYMGVYKHPDDPEFKAAADSVFGELFRRYPGADAIGLVGESLEFPSKDEHTSGKRWRDSVIDGIPETRVAPGWYPCYDYPALLKGIADAVHNVKPEAHVYFSTYNWSEAPAELRRDFISKLPKDVEIGAIGIVYENSGKKTVEGMNDPVRDYSVCNDNPSYYFETEAGFCKEFGRNCGGNVNTAGIGWDFGCVPYVPVPGKLINRHKNLRRAYYDYNMDSHYCTHHMGWTDCVMADLGKWSYWMDYDPDYDELLRKIAIRDYGETNAEYVLKAWDIWSEAADYFVATAEDQYGPLRVGAAYPFIFQPDLSRTFSPKEIDFPTRPDAHFGSAIIKTLYHPFDTQTQAPGFLRFPAEIRSFEKMLELWDKGLEELRKMTELNDLAEQLLALGTFIRGSIVTTIHIKKWWIGNMDFQRSADADEALKKLDELYALLEEERENAKSVIPAVETDSRIGWEPSMEYVCDRWHIEWKLRQLDAAEREMNFYKEMLNEVRKGEQ